MYTNSILAAAGALLSVVAAIPMAEQHHHHMHAHKREYVWVTHVEAVIKTIPVTKTVWVEASEKPSAEKTPEVKHPAVYYTPVNSPPAPYKTPVNSPPAAYTPASSPPKAPAPYVAPSSSSSTTSVYVAPTPTSVYTPPPAPPAPTTSTTTAAPATYAAPAPINSPPPSYDSGSSGGGSGLSSGMGKSGTSYTGDLTYYDVGLGACGKTNVASDHIVAISHVIFDSYSTGNPNTNPLCGKSVTITGADGKSYVATIEDRCPSCEAKALDLSWDFFNLVTKHGDGRVGGMKWSFN